MSLPSPTPECGTGCRRCGATIPPTRDVFCSEACRAAARQKFHAVRVRPDGVAEMQVGKYVALVDAADLPLLLRYSWHASVRRTGVYVATFAKGHGLYLHRILLPGDHPHTDHINGDPLDNRRANLRPATAAQNVANRRAKNIGRSRFRGVYLHRERGKWVAQCRHRTLGYFLTEEEAARAYDAAARNEFGAFASLNLGEESA